MTKLSVIVPCYNCADTVGEAVASLFHQEPGVAFDVTMVDDGSTDRTPTVLASLAKQYPRTSVIRHKSNRGGGAARNSGIAASRGDLVFCLDADDMLAPDFLSRMVGFWEQKRCDAVGMSTNVKFLGKDRNNVAYVTEFERPGRSVKFESFLEGPLCSLSVVFMMTRRAFKLVGGYPTEHGFDTQGMAFRFLGNGLSAYTCPGSTYYHRVGLPKSYYMREQAAGRINWNWLNVLDEFLYLFGPDVRHELLSAELFEDSAGRSPAPIIEILDSRDEIYARGYRRLVRMGARGVARELADSSAGFSRYWLGNYHRLRGAYRRALVEYTRALESGFEYRIVYYRALDSLFKLSGGVGSTPQTLVDLAYYCQPYPERLMPIRHRLFHMILGLPALRPVALSAKHLGDYLKGGHIE